jgi:tetratricopeptide (TPR) repeat protein
MTDHLFERASQLVELGRYPEAEKYIKDILAAEPANTQALVMLAICEAELNRLDEALAHIKEALGQQPTNDYILYLYALILVKKNEVKEAEQYINGAIAFNPQNADYFGLQANIKLIRKEWKLALEISNKGLAIDPENLTCLNIRSTALFKLDKKDEAYATIEEALNYDPEDDGTHANIGWGLLEKGAHKKALEHFREALKINPENNSAKAGLVEGLKARYFLYRIFLKYAFWIGNMKGGLQWGVIIGFYIGSRVLRMIAAKNEAFAPYINPIIFLYTLFAVSTWVIGPLSNLFLRLNVYGRFALTREETKSSNFVGIALFIGLISFILLLIVDNPLFFIIGIFGITMMIPLSSMFNPEKKRSKNILITYAAALAIIGILGIVQVITTGDAGLLASLYLIGIFAYGWVANAMTIR